MSAVPGAREVRDEDAFDVAPVADWLRTHAEAPEGLEDEPAVRQFTGGASNLTYLLRYPSGRDLIIRRAPQGTKAKSAHDMSREYAIQSALAPVFGYVAAMVAFAVAVQGGGVSVFEGVLLLIALGLAIWKVTTGSSGDPLGPEAQELADVEGRPLAREAVRTLLGLLGTLAGAQLLLWGAVDIADRAGLGEGFVGATLVAIGTSLPELVTVIQSARRRETDLIVGNLLGSNMFNALGVGGVIGLLGSSGLDAPALSGFAVVAAVGVSIVVLVMMITRRTIGRLEGILLVVLYAVLVPFLS